MSQKKKSFKEQMLEAQNDIETQDTLHDKIIEEKEAEAEKAKEEDIKTVFDLIEKEQGVTRSQIEEWKADFGGKVFAARFDENEAYIFRYIALPEWKKIMRQVIESKAPNKDELLDDLIFTKCVLHPKIDENFKATVGAGTIPTVALQIKVASNFIHESVALDMVTKL